MIVGVSCASCGDLAKISRLEGSCPKGTRK